MPAVYRIAYTKLDDAGYRRSSQTYAAGARSFSSVTPSSLRCAASAPQRPAPSSR